MKWNSSSEQPKTMTALKQDREFGENKLGNFESAGEWTVNLACFYFLRACLVLVNT